MDDFVTDLNTLVDRSDIPTGYEYVDIYKDAFLIQGAPQPTGSHIKLGTYAGKISGNVTPPDVTAGLIWRNLSGLYSADC